MVLPDSRFPVRIPYEWEWTRYLVREREWELLRTREMTVKKPIPAHLWFSRVIYLSLQSCIAALIDQNCLKRADDDSNVYCYVR